MCGRWVQLEQLLYRADVVSRLASPADTNSKAEAAVLIQHVKEFKCLAINRLIKLEIDRPDVAPGGKSRRRSPNSKRHGTY